jgi:hypothetical protein
MSIKFNSYGQWQTKVLWKSDDGAWVVCEGPFPTPFYRTADTSSLTTAINRNPGHPLYGAWQRDHEQEFGRFAKFRSDDIEDNRGGKRFTPKGEEICP